VSTSRGDAITATSITRSTANSAHNGRGRCSTTVQYLRSRSSRNPCSSSFSSSACFSSTARAAVSPKSFSNSSMGTSTDMLQMGLCRFCESSTSLRSLSLTSEFAHAVLGRAALSLLDAAERRLPRDGSMPLSLRIECCSLPVEATASPSDRECRCRDRFSVVSVRGNWEAASSKAPKATAGAFEAARATSGSAKVWNAAAAAMAAPARPTRPHAALLGR